MNSAPLRVLLVDDDRAMLRILTKWLERAGYNVRTAPDGRQALMAIEAEPPDILITDWEMPELTGLELCRAVREMNLPHYVYVLFLSIKSSPDEMVEGLEVGADDFVIKPVHQGELLARMRAGVRIVQLERRLSRLAHTDALTGLLTQRTFFELAGKEWARATRYHLPTSCVMLDLDYFKRVNDVHGHLVGDQVLKTVGDLLASNCRSSDLVSRYGGEEFCVLLPETAECQAGRWAERIRGQLAALPLRVGRKQLEITASFGVAERNDSTHNSEELVDLADQALLVAKQSGRDRVVCCGQRTDCPDLDGAMEFAEFCRGVTAADIMTPLTEFLQEDQTVAEAAQLFLGARINSAPVVDRMGKLAGVLSEKDLMVAMVAPHCWEGPIRQVMKPHVVTYDEHTPVRTVYEFLCRVTIRRVVIVRDQQPVGTVSRAALLRWFRDQRLSQASEARPIPSATAEDRVNGIRSLALEMQALAQDGLSTGVDDDILRQA